MTDYCRVDVDPFEMARACDGKTVPEIKQICKDAGVRGISGKGKKELVETCCPPLTLDAVKRAWDAATWEREETVRGMYGSYKNKVTSKFPNSKHVNLVVRGNTLAMRENFQSDFMEKEGEGPGDWNGLLEGKGLDTLVSFFGKLMKDNQKDVGMSIKCVDDSTDCASEEIWMISKKGGMVTKKCTFEDEYCPD